ncbi:non-ribosomal peptide synthetase module [Paenibacillus kobensis]|uniref:non-ribosomal peptide synthetase module n=1 Tax=Paenibacillus kobensis TaxID=59841 RepID=UPI000FD7C581|nr:non-ribosomal peptide synthetase module [Paenibacillus kobensis]
MAQRLATQYVKAKLQLSVEEMSRFVRFFEDQQIRYGVKVLENGNQEVVLEDLAGREEIRLVFERHQDVYVCVLSCRLVHPGLTNAMRKAVAAFRGDAIVNRIYSNYTMIYHYNKGQVRRIVESAGGTERIVFEHKDTLGQLERQFRTTIIEREIEMVQGTINELLDLRNQTVDEGQLQDIDLRLREATHQLFVLEA